MLALPKFMSTDRGQAKCRATIDLCLTFVRGVASAGPPLWTSLEGERVGTLSDVCPHPRLVFGATLRTSGLQYLARRRRVREWTLRTYVHGRHSSGEPSHSVLGKMLTVGCRDRAAHNRICMTR